MFHAPIESYEAIHLRPLNYVPETGWVAIELIRGHFTDWMPITRYPEGVVMEDSPCHVYDALGHRLYRRFEHAILRSLNSGRTSGTAQGLRWQVCNWHGLTPPLRSEILSDSLDFPVGFLS